MTATKAPAKRGRPKSTPAVEAYSEIDTSDGSVVRAAWDSMARETEREWMAADGLWLPRKQPWTFHQPGLRSECVGELVQIDGSEHRWFERRGEPCTLLVFIDDATSRLMRKKTSDLVIRPS